MRFYRYRTIKNALLELENGTFYFAEPKELNAPIEGYIKIFWQGDKAAWQGLLKNFVCSLFYNLQTYLLIERNLGGRHKNYNQDFKNRAVIMNLHQFDTSPLKKIFNRLTEEFLSKNSVQEVVNFYSNGNIKCSGKETEKCDKNTENSIQFYRDEKNLINGVRFNNREVQQMIATMMNWNLSEYNYKADGFLADDSETMIFNLNCARRFSKKKKPQSNTLQEIF